MELVLLQLVQTKLWPFLYVPSSCYSSQGPSIPSKSSYPTGGAEIVVTTPARLT